MRLMKTGWFLKEERVKVGETPFGDAKYEYISQPYYPFDMEYEPYSPELARTDYAINVINIKFLMYTYPDDRMKLDAEFVYGNRRYKIIHPPLMYDRHYEVFINDIGQYPAAK
ncbi:hypothetical protein JNUCC23_09565 [Peribacillus sp. JNUCC 23]